MTSKIISNSIVLHDQQRKVFYIEMQGYTASMKYTMLNPTTVDFYSTFVPDYLRGRGIAAQLVKTGFTWANESKYSIDSSCSYVQLKQHRAGR